MPPRPFFALLAGLLTFSLALLLFRHQQASVPSFAYPGFFGSGPSGRSLSAWVLDEEGRYDVVLQDRQQLINRWTTSFDSFTNAWINLWDFFIPSFQCPHRLERVGVMGDGGKWVCGLDRIAKQDKCVIYSFGINDDSSFESALLKRAPGCEVWGYDFSVEHWGPQITNDPELRDRAHFHPWALGGSDDHGEHTHPKYWTLQSLMSLNGHAFIDILKIDTEGAEFDALTSFVNAHAHGLLPIGQLQLEIHAHAEHGRSAYFIKWWESLEAAGLRPFSFEPNLLHVTGRECAKPEVVEYSFINIRGNHALVSDDFN